MPKYLLFIALWLCSVSALGLQLTPSSYELEPSGSLSSHVFEVVNDSKQIIAVEISALTRKWVAEQKEINTPSNNFNIFPAQLILKPQEKKGVRVRWTGRKTLKSEKAFRLVVHQLPVNFNKTKKNSAMKVLHSVVGALYVAPKNARAKLQFGKPSKQIVVNAKSGTTKGVLAFHVENTGSKHILLSKAGILVKGESSVNLTHAMLSQLNTQNVLPGATLHVQLPWPQKLGAFVSSVEYQ